MLSQDESRLIEQAVAAAEAVTSAEIAICIRRASGDDRGIAAGAGAAAAALVLPLLGIWPTASLMISLPIMLILAVGTFLLCDRLDLGLKLLPARLVAQDARRTARAMFLDRGLDTTPQRNAVLLFVSRAERYIEILPDRGLAAKVPPERWADIVALFREIARQKGMVKATAAAVAKIGAVCAGPFPATAENQDHIPNRPMTD